MQRFRLGEWEVLADLNALRRDGRLVHVQPRHMALLLRLASEPGEVVTRARLIEEVWERSHVNDEVLSRAVADLRHVLGDEARSPRLIETIPKRGYRLLVAPRPLKSPGHGRTRLVVGAALGLLAAVTVAAWLLAPPAGDTGVPATAPPRVLTGLPGAEREPSLSPDGSRVAYLADDNGDGTQQVWLVDMDTASRSRLTAEGRNVSDVTWSPDGRRLAVTADDGDGCTLQTLDPDEPDKRTDLAACAPGLGAGIDWSPDGDSLVFAYPADNGGTGLALVRSGGGVEPLTHPNAASTVDAEPRFSPDGRRIAFTRGDRTVREVWVLQPGETHGPRRLTRDGQYAVSLAWLDNQRLLFSSDRGGVQAIRILDTTSGGIAETGIRDARMLDWAAGRLVWERPVYQANIWRIELEGGAARPLVVSNRYDNHPSPSPDGKHLAFLSNRSGRSALWLSDADGRGQRRLLELSSARVSRPAWHPSGAKLLVTVFDARGSHLASVDLDGDHAALPGTEGALEGRWFEGGRKLLVIAAGDDQPGLFVVDSAGGRNRLGSFVPTHAVAGPRGSVYYTLAGKPGLYRLPPESVQPEPVLADLPSAAWNDWDVNASLVAWADGRGVWVKSLDGASPARRVSDRPTGVVGLSLALTTDGRAVLVSYTDDVEIDLMTVAMKP